MPGLVQRCQMRRRLDVHGLCWSGVLEPRISFSLRKALKKARLMACACGGCGRVLLVQAKAGNQKEKVRRRNWRSYTRVHACVHVRGIRTCPFIANFTVLSQKIHGEHEYHTSYPTSYQPALPTSYPTGTHQLLQSYPTSYPTATHQPLPAGPLRPHYYA